mgnify:CR=1 FL=1
MLELDIPGYGALALEHLVLDVNGTIADGGELLPGVAEALAALRGVLRPVAVTADTHGTAGALGETLGIEVRIIASGWEAGDKLSVVQELGADAVVAIGNGANDALVLKACAVGICGRVPRHHQAGSPGKGAGLKQLQASSRLDCAPSVGRGQVLPSSRFSSIR